MYATTGIAVKYNNAKVTKGKTEIKGGKTIKVKINANEKVANYKGKVTVKVYNKKTNKKVKDLSDSFTVKCTKLAVTSVQTASTTEKYLVATFNKALTNLSVADITITEKATGILKGVEKVELASDGKSATISLVGSEDGGNNDFVDWNTDYVFVVSQSGVAASTTFNIDAVIENLVAVGTDSIRKTITIYYFQTTTQSGNIQSTKYINYGATSGFTPNNVLVYAKVVLNSNGTIKTVAYVDK